MNLIVFHTFLGALYFFDQQKYHPTERRMRKDKDGRIEREMEKDQQNITNNFGEYY